MAPGFDIEGMVQKPTWKQILLELIDTRRVDPWNVDIIAIADAFLKRVREMERLDFGVQANVILAAAILLRYKSDYLRYLQYRAEVTDFMPGEMPQGPLLDDVPPLSLASRIPPRRQITLDELVTEMERIIKYEGAERASPRVRGGISEFVDMHLAGMDIDRKMEEVFGKIRENTDETGWSLFSRLPASRDKREVIYVLLCVLHLTQKERIDIRQDELFGEIFIRMLEGGGKPPKRE